ncbi:MAG: hypothetical protein JWP12_2688 [Bacteroidetes bacterium]|nr:hypothetical protein [Bacteroidota bacterium]
MKKNILFTTLYYLLIVSCNQQGGATMNIHPPQIGIDQDTLRVIKEFKGLYMNDGKNKLFISCDHPEIKHLIENKSNQADTILKSILPHAYAGEAIYIEMKAEINPSPDPQFQDLLVIKEFGKAEQKNRKNTCVPYDYWCTGTEPFWQLQISEKENLIDFYDPNVQTTLHFSYSQPQIINGTTIFSAKNATGTISVKIKNEKCSDGMSDIEYSCKAEVVINKNEYKGCAIRYGEAIN